MDRMVNLQGTVEEKKEEDQSPGFDRNSHAVESGSDDGGLPTVGQALQEAPSKPPNSENLSRLD